MVIYKAIVEIIKVLTNKDNLTDNLAQKTIIKAVTFLQLKLMLLFQKTRIKISTQLFVSIIAKKAIIPLSKQNHSR